MSEKDALLSKSKEHGSNLSTAKDYGASSVVTTSNGSGLTSNSVVDVTALTRPDVVPVLKDKARERKRWISLYVIYFTMFLGSVTFSVVISSVYPYLQKITDNKAPTSFLGYIVAVYSFGQLVSSPILGFWSDRQHAMVPILTSLIITTVFNLLYCYAIVFPSAAGQYVLIISRAMVGVGAGVIAVCRSYASAATTPGERTAVFGALSAMQAIGFIIGPVLGLIFVPLGGNGFYWEPLRFHFDIFTGPAYLSALLAIVNGILVIAFFREYRLTAREHKTQKLKKLNINDGDDPGILDDSATVNEQAEKTTDSQYDRFGAYVCIVIFFCLLFGFSVYETIVTPYSMDEFAWTKKQAVLYNNILFGLVSIISATNFTLAKYIVKCIDERTVLMVGLILMAIGFLIYIPMGNDFPQVGILIVDTGVESNVTEANITDFPLLSLHNSSVSLGCHYPKHPWCLDVPKMYIFQYILGAIVFTLGYPAGMVVCFAIFSRILGPKPQGMMMGIISASGSSARCVGPLIITLLYDKYGPQVAMATVIGITGLAIILLAISYYRLVPFGSKRGFSKRI